MKNSKWIRTPSRHMIDINKFYAFWIEKSHSIILNGRDITGECWVLGTFDCLKKAEDYLCTLYNNSKEDEESSDY